MRSGVLYEIYEQSGDADAGQLALLHYRQAREAWETMASRAKGVYHSDITYGSPPGRRGHWLDRLTTIDKDIADLETKLQSPLAPPDSASDARAAITAALGRPRRPAIPCKHSPPASFHPGRPLDLSLQIEGAEARSRIAYVRLYYRHVSQAERWRSAQMQSGPGLFAAQIAGDYTDSPFALAVLLRDWSRTKVGLAFPRIQRKALESALLLGIQEGNLEARRAAGGAITYTAQ